jgi:asparagine synthase (glutamine-hydrolysing)
MFESGAQPEARLMEEMARLLAHRGPNEEACHFSGPLAFAFRRLSIIDVAGGHQPMCNEDGTLWLVFNGEIFNYRELREELAAKGHLFRTVSDSEVILHLYEEHGAECPARLRGMFAFALWDSREQSLFVARDRFGIKPLYYRMGPRSFSFASEVKPLLLDPECDETLDDRAVYDYLSSFVFGERTMFRAVRRLLPSHWMRVKEGRVETRRYWQPRVDGRVRRADAGENIEELHSLLRDAMKGHLLSERPQGAFLSGGVDSSLITALMAETSGHSVETFCSTFPGGGAFDESRHAAEVARQLGTRHREIPCKPEHLELLPAVLWHLEEPLADAPAIALYQLCHEAARHVTVVHCGDGGDEGFGGYTRYYWDRFARAWGSVPRALRAGPAMAAFRMLQQISPTRNLGRRAEKFSRYADLSPAERYMAWFCVNPEDAKQRLLSPGFGARMNAEPSVLHFQKLFDEAKALGLDALGTLQYVDLFNFVPYSLMLKGDKLTMAAGIEGRFLWLDHPVVEFGLSLPPEQKLRGRHTKMAPRRVLERYIGGEEVWRPKQGFGVPIEDWFKGSLRPVLEETIEAARADEMEIIDPAELRRLCDRLLAGDPHVWPHVWSVHVLYQWRRVFARPRESVRAAIKNSSAPVSI